MTQRIGAIETEYAGHRFRSRLEARWAVFFDALGIEWRYETQGFQHGSWRYLPDFELPKLGLWAEVKGDPEGLRQKFDCLTAILGADSPLPRFADSYRASPDQSLEAGLLVLGDLPLASGLVAHPVLTNSAEFGLRRDWAIFCSVKVGADVFPAGTGVVAYLNGLFPSVHLEKDRDDKGWRVETIVLPAPTHWPEIEAAYRAGRGARFEHGEAG